MKRPQNTLKITIIITTYNWPEALALILRALAHQTWGKNFEVIVADDGSKTETRDAIEAIKGELFYPLKHVWQPDDGFRAASIRNRAALAATGNYLIFLDGDTVPTKKFLENHSALAQKGFFVAGNRVLLSQEFTAEVLQSNLPIYLYGGLKWLRLRFTGAINRYLPLLHLSLGLLRRFRTNSWRGAKTCNLAIWRDDFLAVNGFDESYQGWGYEDSDLVIRLMKFGVRRLDGRFALAVLHLWHPANVRDNAAQNYARLREVLLNKQYRCQVGIEQAGAGEGLRIED